MTQPVIVTRPAQPYIAYRVRTPMDRLAAELPPLVPRAFGWAAQRGLEVTGPPFFKYDLVNMSALMEVEVGLTVASAPPGEVEVSAGVLPAGRYATAVHVGHPAGLLEATRDLLAWAEAEGVVWDVVAGPEGDLWVARLEFYRTDPAQEPDMAKWETEMAFKLAD